MQLWEWLRSRDVRLDIKLECELDPKEEAVEWHCRILGFPSPNSIRPAVYILEYPDGPEALIEAFAGDPATAYRDTVHQLRGKVASVVGGGRDETLIFPDDLTV